MNEFGFGLLQPYVEDVMITDINYNGVDIWIDHLSKGRYRVEGIELTAHCEQLAYKFANYANLPFNTVHPVVESATNELRISLVHPSVSKYLSISIRKTPAILRLTPDVIRKQKIAPSWVLEFLKQCVKYRCNILVSGLPGSGKTEFVKYLASNIDPSQRVITIEDTYELRYGVLFPKSDCVALKVNEYFDYSSAIKTCLRQRPDWMLVSEVRGKEVVGLLQSVSTGANLLSTLHASSAFMIPKRMLHMFESVELSNETIMHMICESIDIGVHMEALITRKGVRRYVKEVCCFYVKDDEIMIEPIYQVSVGQTNYPIWPDKLLKKKQWYENCSKGGRSG